jgi:transcriptional regulator with XRE-family HTH domain
VASEVDYAAANPGDLRARREGAAISVRELARRSGYSTSYLSRVETGKRAATADIVRLYTALRSTEPASKSPGERCERVLKAPIPRPPLNRHLDLGIVWFGAELRRRRMAAGKSLRALGADVYLSRAYLGKIEQGRARGNYQQALALDNALQANGSLARLFLDECARVGPVAPDTGILIPEPPTSAAAKTDLAELAAATTTRLERLRVRSHEEGPHAVLRDLGETIAELYSHVVAHSPATARPIWVVALRYAELLGWTAQETGHDDIALRWTRAVADWAKVIGDDEALGYALTRQSQWARRRGDADAAIGYARRASAIPHISPRIARFAAQREAQACALAHDEAAFRHALDRSCELLGSAPSIDHEDRANPRWGPLPDPAFEESRLFEATCLVDLGDFATAASLFAEHMGRLGRARTGYARIAVRQAIAYAHVAEPEHACEVVLDCLPTVARQGSASLRGDLSRLTRALNRHRDRSGVRDLLPDLTMLARAAGSVPIVEPAQRPDRVSSPGTEE